MIKEHEFGHYYSLGLCFTLAPEHLYDDGAVSMFTVTILYEDMEALGERLGIDPRRDDWLTEASFHEEIEERIEEALPFLAGRYHDSIADEAGEVWRYNADGLQYHASKHGVTIKYKVTA